MALDTDALSGPLHFRRHADFDFIPPADRIDSASEALLRPEGRVVAVCKSAEHTFSKIASPSIQLIEGFGIEGDTHAGRTVKHWRHAVHSPTGRNLRQVHLMPWEFLESLRDAGFDIAAGALGENITVSGIDLQNLPLGTRLEIGSSAVVELTGLRYPCNQINKFRKGLMSHMLRFDERKRPTPKCGAMGVVAKSGLASIGDRISLKTPALPHRPLPRV